MTMLVKHLAHPAALELVMNCLEIVGCRTTTEDLGLQVMLPGHIMMVLMGTGSPETYVQPLPDPFKKMNYEQEIEQGNEEEQNAKQALAAPATAP